MSNENEVKNMRGTSNENKSERILPCVEVSEKKKKILYFILYTYHASGLKSSLNCTSEITHCQGTANSQVVTRLNRGGGGSSVTCGEKKKRK